MATPALIEQLRAAISAFNFQEFREVIGWDRLRTPQSVTVEGVTYTLAPIAEKRGFAIYRCSPAPDGKLPDYPTRMKIEAALTKLKHEHLIIFVDAAQQSQVWQRVIRGAGRPTVRREFPYYKGQSGQALALRLADLFVGMDEEQALTLVEVTGRADRALNIEKVTKRFYDRFKDEHARFLKQIEGIPEEQTREWYASLTLNRLMFTYFIQDKGFLDGDTAYLRNRLARIQTQYGPDQFYGFFRTFLLRLFHEGLGRPEAERTPELNALIGDIPYLNGGLFERHQIEQAYPDLNIPDAAFARIFDFFDSYSWKLEDRPDRDDKVINPDVLGYIFEKYINQKQMGAYYTKEDITDYIGKNTILPFVLERARRECEIAFAPEGEVWRLLRDDPDRYIYPAVRKGADQPLPSEIAAGIDDVTRRDGWNRPADPAIALPTETWRELVARRQRYADLRAKLANGEIIQVNDLITYNLDIRRFAEDVATTCEDALLLAALWNALTGVTILDPTCGSGAFLFAALEILRPLYEACLDRMAAFVDEADRLGKPNRHTGFRETLAAVKRHPNRAYYILKTIIVNNLYGVDIMEEATEIARLRLFLALVAEVQTKDRLEPLPDIDFNIRAGNTLVGFTTLDAVRSAITVDAKTGLTKLLMDVEDERTLARIEQQAAEAGRAYVNFQRMQTDWEIPADAFHAAKDDLNQRLATLRTELDAYLAREYRIDANDAAAFARWRASHQPLHWFTEFYRIMQGGGFDVIIGNPPYVEYSKVKKEYQVHGYATESCGNLYAMMIERAISLGYAESYYSLIVPISATCTERTTSLQQTLQKMKIRWYSSFDVFPARLFEGAAQRLSILIFSNSSNLPRQMFFASKYYRWVQDERPELIPRITYTNASSFDDVGWCPRADGNLAIQALQKVRGKPLNNFFETPDTAPLYVHRIINNFIKAVDFPPFFRKASGEVTTSDDFKRVSFKDGLRLPLMAVLNSNTFYWYWRIHGDGFHCGYRDIGKFLLDVNAIDSQLLARLADLATKLGQDLKDHSEIRHRDQVRTGRIELQTFFVGASKPIIDEIDRVLAEHYGFTDEELDYIINYDIKYRMGLAGDGNGEGEEDDGEE